MDFRRKGKVLSARRPAARKWVDKAHVELGLPSGVQAIYPQDVVSLLCRAYSEKFGNLLTPVEIDDFFMEAGGAPCKDRNPLCHECRLVDVCQANNDPRMQQLKACFT